MEKKMEEHIDMYLELLNRIKAEVIEEGTAVRVLSEVAKDRRMDQIRQEKQQSVQTVLDGPATGKQMVYLKKLGVEAFDGLTKRKASEMIDSELARNGKE